MNYGLKSLIDTVKKYTFTFLLLFCCLIEGRSQFNIKVGYGGGYMEPTEINEIIGRFNNDKPFLEQKLNDINFLSGLELGLRYRFGISAFEIAWNSGSAEAEAFGTKDGSPFQEAMKASLRTYSIGVDNFIGDFGFGASIGNRRLKFTTDITGFNKDRTILTQTALASRFHVFFQVKSNNVSLTFKPYVEFPWDSYNVSALNREYFPDSTIPDADFDTDLTVFGLSVVFYNGPQR